MSNLGDAIEMKGYKEGYAMGYAQGQIEVAVRWFTKGEITMEETVTELKKIAEEFIQNLNQLSADTGDNGEAGRSEL